MLSKLLQMKFRKPELVIQLQQQQGEGRVYKLTKTK